MKNNLKTREVFEEKFESIKKRGYIKSLRKGYTGVGYTFETLMGKKEDAMPFPDFDSLEIKTTAATFKKDLTLFSYAPESDLLCETERLLREYGYQRKTGNDIIAFRYTFYCNNITIVQGKYKAKLEIDKDLNVLVLKIYDMYMNDCIDCNARWELDYLTCTLESKLSNLVFVKASKRNINGELYYYYDRYVYYELTSVEKFLELLECGDIYVQFTIAIKEAEDGRLYMDNHGTQFKLKEHAIEKLFNRVN